MFSGATPSEPDRIAWLSRMVPLAALEGSHFIGSLAGFGLLIVAWGLSRRLDAAYYLAVGGLVLGLLASLLKGGDYEEATLMVGLLAILVPARREFDRKASLFEVPFSPAWLTAICAVVLPRLRWGCSLTGTSSTRTSCGGCSRNGRTRRGSCAPRSGCSWPCSPWDCASCCAPRHAEAERPDEQQLADAARVIGRQPQTSANLVFLRDKALMWSDARDAFLMYGVQGRTWVALGDPVGPRAAAEPLVKRFLEHADDYDGIPVFYQTTGEWLPRYADFGLTFAKLGEEARVSLSGFTLEGGGTAKTLRTSCGAC